MSTELKALDVKIINHHANRQVVEDLVNAFSAAGKLAQITVGQSFVRYEAMCPLAAENSITDTELSALRTLGASANIRTVPAPV